MGGIIAQLDDFMRNRVWGGFLVYFSALDWVIAFFFLGGLFYGMKKGLMRELALVMETLVTIYLIFAYYEPVGAMLESWIPQLTLTYAVLLAFFLLLIVVSLILRFIDGVVKDWLKTELVAPIKIVGGGLLGIFHFLLFLSLFSHGLTLIPSKPIQQLYDPGNSCFGFIITKLAPKMYQVIEKPLSYFLSF